MTEATASAGQAAPAHLTREDVAHLAHLARLAIPADELDHYAEQLDAILVSVSRVAQVAAADVPPMSHPQACRTSPGPTSPSRADSGRGLSGAPAEEDDRFRVPRILEDSE